MQNNKHLMIDRFDFPININNAFGDPLLSRQIDNTIMKIKALSTYKGIFSVCTKNILEKSTAEKLKKIRYSNNFFPMYSLTGLVLKIEKKVFMNYVKFGVILQF